MKKLLTGIILLFPLLLQAQGDQVSFSRNGGVYDRPFMLTLRCNSPVHHIYYTLNGSIPTSSSHLYTHSLLVNQQLYSSSHFYQQHTIPLEEELFIPDTILRSVVIRAAVFDEAGNRISSVVTNSYFIRSMGCDFHRLPVVSICADSVSLYDENIGILVPGVHYDEEDPLWTGNYYLKGEEWERLCNVEYYADGNNGFNQEAGLRTHGGNGRRFDQKGLKIYARKEYGKKRFEYKIFNDCNVIRFKHLVLKPYKCSWTEAGVQNYLSYQIGRNLDLDVLALRPVVLFLNGEYWGIYFIQERSDDHYLEDHYNIDCEDINVIGNWFGLLEAGEGTGFMEMMDFVESADFSDSVQYQRISEQVDIENFIDYQLLEIFIANEDWPANNMRCWQAMDRKWRWIFYDGDGGFRMLNKVFFNAISESHGSWPTNAQSTLMFRRLLQNKTFRKQFVKRFNELSETYLSYRYTGLCLRDIQNQIQDEIPRQSSRFGNPISVRFWEKAVNDVDDFLQKRPQIVKDSLRLRFNLPEDAPFNSNSEIVISPNPTSGIFYLLFKSEDFGVMDVYIRDILGRTCYANTIFYDEGENIIPIQCHLHSGTYIVTTGKVSKKIVITR